MSASFSNEIGNEFPDLLARHGFRLVEEKSEGERHFGDSLAVFESDHFRIRFVRDRGQVFVDVGPCDASAEWHQLVYVLEFLDTETIGPAYETEGWRELLKRLFSCHAQVSSLLAFEQSGGKRSELSAFEKERAKERLLRKRHG